MIFNIIKPFDLTDLTQYVQSILTHYCTPTIKRNPNILGDTVIRKSEQCVSSN